MAIIIEAKLQKFSQHYDNPVTSNRFWYRHMWWAIAMVALAYGLPYADTNPKLIMKVTQEL